MLVLLLFMHFCTSRKSPARYFYNGNRPLVIAHRGACGYIPEHTLQAYETAAYMGADFIEPDLVPTKDFKLVVNHESLLDQTTNVNEMPQFSYLQTTKSIPTYEGILTQTGWFSEDFSLDQIKQLKAKQRIRTRPQGMNLYFGKLTIEEVLDWVIGVNKIRLIEGTPLLGVYIELKDSAYFNSLGFNVEDMLLDVLKDRKIDSIEGASMICPIILQSFELQSLITLGNKTDLPLVYLLEEGYILHNISYYANFVDGVGPGFNLIFDEKCSLTDFVDIAHENNLAVHMWVVKKDKPFCGFEQEETYKKILDSHVDGVFDEFPDLSIYYFTHII
ncbi:hypothetical protein SteCoe_8341 [Stentor coeruleus]|uniref:glycerophosphodiester phosphodiesterase n=1 Tax=Stentor coeruleus TaxID=5963 RepID=A0A1R2CKP5_9CILI|nr:hypothetical protein SteCoe_8341 [Stentor coeruleus]